MLLYPFFHFSFAHTQDTTMKLFILALALVLCCAQTLERKQFVDGPVVLSQLNQDMYVDKAGKLRVREPLSTDYIGVVISNFTRFHDGIYSGNGSESLENFMALFTEDAQFEIDTKYEIFSVNKIAMREKLEKSRQFYDECHNTAKGIRPHMIQADIVNVNFMWTQSCKVYYPVVYNNNWASRIMTTELQFVKLGEVWLIKYMKAKGILNY